MERHRCKQCYRRFASGRALAGHMRSHVSHAMPRRRRPRPRPLPSPSASSSSPHPPAKSLDEEAPPPEFSSSSAFQDRESDAESSLNRRPKRPRAELPATDEPLSSVSDASSEEDVARCLMLLSRDAWSKSEAEERQSNGCDEVDAEDCEDEEEDGIGSGSRRRRRSRFQCGTCRKVFRSYQALGGHRASHKRVGVECVPITAMTPIHGEDSSGGATAAHRGAKLWECPYCYRVFGSGQALGGHKRSHLSSSATAIATTSPAIPLPHPRSPSAAAAVAKNNSSGIDLNLPAPTEDEVELSALSVATDLSRK